MMEEDILLKCSVLNSDNYDVKFSDVYGDTEQQFKATIAFKNGVSGYYEKPNSLFCI